MPNQHNYVLTTDTAVAPVGDPVGYMGSHRQNLPENFVKNSMMVGASGTGGSPTLWAHTSAAQNGVSISFVGTGTDVDGAYAEYSMSGTDAGTGSGFIQVNPNGLNTSTDHPAALYAQLWSGQLKVKGVSGTQRSSVLVIREINSGGTGLGTDTNISFTPTNGAIATISGSRALNQATTARLRLFMQVQVSNGSGTWDNVFRIYAPQLERGKPTAFTPTYGSAITRGANFEPAWQDTTANKPLLGVDADGKSILTYDGTNDFFRTGIQTPEAVYVAGVWQTSSTGSTIEMFSSSNAASVVGARLLKGPVDTIQLQRSDGSSISAADTVGTTFGSGKIVVDGHYQLTGASVRKNGVNEAVSAGSRNATSTNYFRIGAAGAGGDTQANYWGGTMLAHVWIPGARPGATVEAEIRRLLAEITAVSGVV